MCQITLNPSNNDDIRDIIRNIIKFPASNSEEDITTRDAILSEVTDLIRTNFNVNQELFNGIYYLIAELTDNISQHSEVEKGWITSQFFPQKEFIDLCIADTGMGIYNSYMR